MAAPVALHGLVLALLLKQVPMRGGVGDNAADVGAGFAMPDVHPSEELLEAAVTRVLRVHGRGAAPGVLASARTRLDVAQAWCVSQVQLRVRLVGHADINQIAEQAQVPAAVLWPAFARTVAAGWLGSDGERLWLTDTGTQEIGTIIASWRAWLSGRLSAHTANESMTGPPWSSIRLGCRPGGATDRIPRGGWVPASTGRRPTAFEWVAAVRA